ncbi:MAG: tryptophan-rich sensory protein, partial [Clostridia bacterium]|nr:tryptophan-rich sensory protein [Clostridia bacterium]
WVFSFLRALCANVPLVVAVVLINMLMEGSLAPAGCEVAAVVMVALRLVFYALFGAAAGIIISTPYYRKSRGKLLALALALCTLFLCFTWIPLVYTAASFFIAFMVCLIVIVFCAVLFKFYLQINSVAAFSVLIFAFFELYLACYSLSLFILN